MNMNGREKKVWKGVHGFPNKIFPGGYLMTSRGSRDGRYGVQDGLDLVQIDWDETWSGSSTATNTSKILASPAAGWPAATTTTSAKADHRLLRARHGAQDRLRHTLVLAHRNARNPKDFRQAAPRRRDPKWTGDGDIVWEWHCNEHFDEMGFREGPKNTPPRPQLPPDAARRHGRLDAHQLHVRARPEQNGVTRATSASIPTTSSWTAAKPTSFSSSPRLPGKSSGLGPDYDNSPEAKAIGWIIGQHHCHMILRGLPRGHYPDFRQRRLGRLTWPNPGSPTGVKAALRDHSRVLEIDPVAMKIVWQYTPHRSGLSPLMDCNRFYSPFISGMQRLPNGNTLITEGSDGRVFEVTKDHELVWEFISPYSEAAHEHGLPRLPRALRVGPAARQAGRNAH